MTVKIEDNTIERAAKIVKIIYLASLPGMDEVAIKLNCGATYDEIRNAKRWARAFELASDAEESTFVLAEKLHKEFQR
jgi:hypothetical protein